VGAGTALCGLREPPFPWFCKGTRHASCLATCLHAISRKGPDSLRWRWSSSVAAFHQPMRRERPPGNYVKRRTPRERTIEPAGRADLGKSSRRSSILPPRRQTNASTGFSTLPMPTLRVTPVCCWRRRRSPRSSAPLSEPPASTLLLRSNFKGQSGKWKVES